MIQWFESIDRALVLAINGLHTPFWDEFMWIVSAKLTWFPAYFLLLYLCWRKLGSRATLWYLITALIAVGLSDLLASQVIKESVMRYRPSHNTLLTERLHFYTLPDGEPYKGGMYGFVSSHAANFFAMATVSFLVLKSKYTYMGWCLFGIATIVCLSRVYLGVHYLSDLVCGGILGASVAILTYRYVYLRFNPKKLEQ